MEKEHYLQAALATTTFSRSQLEMLNAKLAESPSKTGLLELKTTATMDGVEIGSPYKTVAVVKDGRIHRDNGPAVAIDDLVADGAGVKEAKTVLYMRNGVPDREDGPAVLAANGNVLWMQKGQLHRDNGPAAMIDGQPTFALEGKALTAKEFGQRMGLGEPGKDWMVEPNTGTMFTGLCAGEPAVTTMRESRLSVAPAVTVEDPEKPDLKRVIAALPRLHAATEAARDAGEAARAVVLERATTHFKEFVDNPARQVAMVQKLGKAPELSGAKVWVGMKDLPPGEVAATLRYAAEHPTDKNRLKDVLPKKGLGL